MRPSGTTAMKVGETSLVLLLVALVNFTGLAREGLPQNSKSGSSGSGVLQQAAGQTSVHPWPMLHGDYRHRGFAAVQGPQTGQLKWKFEVGARDDGFGPSSVVISGDGTLYTTGPDKVIALTRDGTEKWSRTYTGADGLALAEDGTLYVTFSRSIAALDPNGHEQWRFDTGNETLFGSTVGPDGTLYQGSWDGFVYALNPAGSLKWKHQTSGAVSYPASIDDHGFIYLGGGDAHAGPDPNVYAFEVNGGLRWQFDTGELRVGSPAIGLDGLIYAPASPSLLAFDASGNLRWRLGPQRCAPPPAPCGPAAPSFEAGIITPAIGPDGTIYSGSSRGVLSAIDPSTQAIKWTFPTGPDPEDPTFFGLPSFPVVDAEGTVFVGSVDGRMYAIDRHGNLKWSFQTGRQITEASPALDADGTLYFTSHDGFLYAIAPPAAGALTIGALTLPEGEEQVVYNASLGLSGGTPPYDVRVVQGALPPGLTVDGEGTISGTPTQAGTYPVTLQVTDQEGTSVSKPFEIKIFKALSITSKRLKSRKVGKKYVFTLKATGGKKPYTWSMTAGTLPAGLQLESTTGKITGTPLEAGSFHLTFQVTDHLGVDEASFVLTIKPS